MVLSKQKIILSIFLTSISLAPSHSLANRIEIEEVAPVKTKKHVLSYVKTTLEQLKAGHCEFAEQEKLVVNAVNELVPEGHLLQASLFKNQYFRKRVLVNKFSSDVATKRQAYESALHQRIMTAGLDEDLVLRTMVALKRTAVEKSYDKVCNAYRKAYFHYKLVLNPALEDQSKKFLRYSPRLTSVLSGDVVMNHRGYKELQEAMVHRNNIRLEDVVNAQSGFKAAARDLSLLRDGLGEKLNKLLNAAHMIQKARNDRRYLARLLGKGGIAVKRFYWTKQKENIGIALGS